MQATLLTNLMLPLALGVIMLGLGLGLTVEDFRRVARYPRAVLVGLALQTLLLPWAAFGLALAFRLPPELAVGLMLLAASPGGATANIYSHLARGDVALNITLTAINSVLCLLTLPLILNLALEHFLGAGQYVPPPTRKIVEVAVIILLPVLLGMTVRGLFPALAARAEKPLRLPAVQPRQHGRRLLGAAGAAPAARAGDRHRDGDRHPQRHPGHLHRAQRAGELHDRGAGRGLQPADVPHRGAVRRMAGTGRPARRRRRAGVNGQ